MRSCSESTLQEQKAFHDKMRKRRVRVATNMEKRGLPEMMPEALVCYGSPRYYHRLHQSKLVCFEIEFVLQKYALFESWDRKENIK